MPRIVVGFLVAALWLPALGYALDNQLRPFWAIMFGFYTIPLTLVIAVPLFYFLRRKITFLRCLAIGAGIGLIGALTLISSVNPLAISNGAAAMLISGALSGTIFFVVGVWCNPWFKRHEQAPIAT